MSTGRLPAAVSQVPLLDIGRGHESLRGEMLEAIAGVLDSGRFLHGPEVGKLETSIATRCGVSHAIGCASGSDALLLALLARGVGPGDEVIVPSFTFFATASAVWRLGAQIVFADVDPATFNLDPEDVRKKITARTRVIIPVHLFGQCAEMDTFCEMARQHHLWVVEDAAQSIGAEYLARAAGAWGDVGCFSFYPTKNLGGCGDGGMLTTRDDELDRRLRLLASHGMSPRYYHPVVGINSRLDSIQAAVLNVKLARLDAWTAERQANAARYRELFAETHLDSRVHLPQVAHHRKHVWNQYTIRVLDGRRDQLREHLGRHGVGTEIYYPLPLHLQQCFSSLGYGAESLPETERAAREVLNLPIFPGLTADEQRFVVGCIQDFFAARQAKAA